MNEPTGYTALDLIGYTDKGDYSPVATYVKNDLVNYGGTKWRCKIDDTTAVTPTEGVNWTVFVAIPADTTKQIIAPVEGATSLHAYAVGEQLIYNDTLYKVIAPIAVNDALVVDTNIEVSPKTVIEQVEDNANAISQLSNPNLLDNPWFTVNQRGKASYSGNDNYTVDRWQRRNTTDVTVDANGITIKSTRTGVQADTWFRQHICTNAEAAIRFIGKPLTATILFQDGTIEVLKANNYQGDISKSFTYNGCSMRMNLLNDTTQGTLQFFIWQFTYNVSVAIKAVKLEVGYISTLLLDTAPNYVDELLKCQYYFVRIKGISGSSIGNGWFTESNKAWMQAPLPRPLRSSTPTITLNGTMYVWSPTKLGSNGYQSTAVVATSSNTSGSLFYQMQISGTETVGNCAMSQFRDTTSYLDVSADF